MALNAVELPQFDPTPIFDHFRSAFGTNLLIAGIAHFRVFELLSIRPMTFAELRQAMQLEERPAIVLLTVLCGMDLLTVNEGTYSLSPLAAEQLAPGGYFSIADYLTLAANSPAVVELVEKLRANRPAVSSYIYKEGEGASMEEEASARQLTLALAGRAKNVAPVLAERAPLGKGVLLDLGGGTGIYAIAFLQKNPELRAIVFDRPEVLRMAREFAEAYGVADRMEFHAGDMFTGDLPPADYVLLSNILHDWGVDDCRRLVARSAACLRLGGAVMIHDVLLNDALDGPLSVACYSAQLFTITEGRAYSAAEYTSWLGQAGLQAGTPVPTLAQCHVITATAR